MKRWLNETLTLRNADATKTKTKRWRYENENRNNMAAHRTPFLRLLLLALTAMLCSCSHEEEKALRTGIAIAEDTISFQDVFGNLEGDVLVINQDVDLQGKLCTLPKGLTLNYQGGIIENGTLVGDETKIKCHGACFDRVRILGSWDVPEINTSLFKDLDYDNSLKDVVALTSPDVKNRVVIEEGDYQVSALHSNDACLPLGSNTELIVNGVIRMVPNDYEICYVIQAIGENIDIHGNGTIIGDKHTHTGEIGEWGMGISLRAARRARINGLTIKDCWGDCVYIDDGSKDVIIENCHLDHGRRQGISVVFADSVTIRNCTITNVGGTAPEYAIDVEPDENKTVNRVVIENVTVTDCKGGFLVYGKAQNAKVGTVVIRDCSVEAVRIITIAANQCDTLKIENCTITQRNTWGCIVCNNVKDVTIKGNTLIYDNGIVAKIKDRIRPLVGNKRVKVMDFENCESTRVTQNVER